MHYLFLAMFVSGLASAYSIKGQSKLTVVGSCDEYREFSEREAKVQALLKATEFCHILSYGQSGKFEQLSDWKIQSTCNLIPYSTESHFQVFASTDIACH